MGQFHFNPDTYLDLMAEEVPAYERQTMLARAREACPSADLRVAQLEDPLPDGPFDLVVSALTVHHLDGTDKADLFRRVASVLRPGGRFVLGDPADVITPIDGVYDTPSRVEDQLRWLTDAGYAARLVWADRDLAVLAAERADGS